MTFLVVGLAVWALVSGLTWGWWFPSRLKIDERSWDVYIADIRAMNDYNAHFLEGIVIFLAVAVVGSEVFVYEVGLTVLLAAFVLASLAMFFFPLPRVAEKEADTDGGAKPERDREGETRRLMYVRRKWIFTIVLSQGTVILTSTGVLAIIVNFIQLPVAPTTPP